MADDTISYWDWKSRSLRALLKDLYSLFILFIKTISLLQNNQFKIFKLLKTFYKKDFRILEFLLNTFYTFILLYFYFLNKFHFTC